VDLMDVHQSRQDLAETITQDSVTACNKECRDCFKNLPNKKRAALKSCSFTKNLLLEFLKIILQTYYL